MKIGVWEASLTNLAEPLSKTTRALTQGYIPWNRKETLKHSGEFAALRWDLESFKYSRKRETTRVLACINNSSSVLISCILYKVSA